MKALMAMGAAVLLCASSVWAAVQTPDLTVLPAAFRGVVLYEDGETPVSGLPVRVWDAKTEKVVFRTKTNADGVFTIPEMDEGDRYVTVGSVRIDMRLLTARAGIVPQTHGLVVVMPKAMPLIPLAPILIPTTAAAALVPQIVSP